MNETGVAEMDEATYHAHPALSSSGARRLLPPSCPARFKWERDNGRPEKRAFDFGHAAHREVLGIGMDIVVVQRTAKDGTVSNAEDYKTKSAQEHRDAIYAEGKCPLLAHEVEQVKGMALALLAHPWASVLFDPDRGGKAEQSIFWHDKQHGVDRRARLDWLPESDGGRLIVPDYKSTVSALPSAFAKSAANFGYHQQDDWYREAVRAAGLAEDVSFVFVVQEKVEPYLISVVELDAPALRIGHLRNQQALEVFAECSATDSWPGYSEDVELVSLPRWATFDYEDVA